MKMRRCALRVTSRADVAKHRACGYPVADLNSRRVRFEMCVVINATTRADNRNCLSTEIVLADLVDHAAGCREYRRSLRCEDVLAFMQTIRPARGMPGVGDLSLLHLLQRHRQFAIRLLHRELCDSRVEDEFVSD